MCAAFLDTSMVVRYLTGDPPHLADRAAQLIDRDDEVVVTGVVLAEVAHVLRSFYKAEREDVIDSLMSLLQRRNVTPFALDEGLVLQGLLLCRDSGRVSVPDTLIWAAARSAGAEAIYTMDSRFPAEGVHLEGLR